MAYTYFFMPKFWTPLFLHICISIYNTILQTCMVLYVLNIKLFNIFLASAQLLGKPLLLESTLSLNNLQLVGNINVHCCQSCIKLNYMKTFVKKLGYLMISYLKSSEKHAFGIPCFTFKLYSNIIVPISVLLDIPSSK